MAMLKEPGNPASHGSDESLETLLELHTLSVDSLSGFEKMVEKADPEFRVVAERFAALHTRHVARLATMAREMGGLPDTDGSAMGTVKSAMAALRSVFDAIDQDMMDRIRRGEQPVLAAFDHAIASSLPQGHTEALVQMRTELTGLLDESRHLG